MSSGNAQIYGHVSVVWRCESLPVTAGQLTHRTSLSLVSAEGVAGCLVVSRVIHSYAHTLCIHGAPSLTCQSGQSSYNNHSVDTFSDGGLSMLDRSGYSAPPPLPYPNHLCASFGFWFDLIRIWKFWLMWCQQICRLLIPMIKNLSADFSFCSLSVEQASAETPSMTCWPPGREG